MPARPIMMSAGFPFLFGGTFIEGENLGDMDAEITRFPFLFGGTFIEGPIHRVAQVRFGGAFPFLFGGTFIEGEAGGLGGEEEMVFPFLFGGTFIEGPTQRRHLAPPLARRFPFLFGGTFIEGGEKVEKCFFFAHFPSFSEGLSLRALYRVGGLAALGGISLPFRRDFH